MTPADTGQDFVCPEGEAGRSTGLLDMAEAVSPPLARVPVDARPCAAILAGMLERYVQRFTASVKALGADRRVRIVKLQTFPGLKPKEIKAWEASRGLSLDPALRAFYGQTNGLMLRWILEEADEQRAWVERVPAEETGWDYAVGDYPQDQGVVLLRPLDELTAPGFWAEGELEDEFPEEIAIDRVTMTEGEQRQRVLAWDLWSYSSFATLLPRADGPWVVLHGSDHGATFFDDRPTDVETYLEFVLACLGQRSIRYRTFNIYRDGASLRGEGLLRVGRAHWEAHPFSREALLEPR